MIYRSHKLKIITAIHFLVFLLSSAVMVYSAEKLDEESMESMSAQAGITLIFDDFQIAQSQPHIAIGGDDGLGIPEAPDGAWFVIESTRVTTLDLSDAYLSIDCVAIGKDDSALTNAVFDHEGSLTTKPVVLFDLGAADFYSFASGTLMSLKFGNNRFGYDEEDSDDRTFTHEIAEFQLDGATMSVKSEDAKIYVFAHPDGNFEITPP